MYAQPAKRNAQVGAALLTLNCAGAALAQISHSSGDRQTAKRGGSDSMEVALPKQLAELREKVARLEAALEQNHQVQSSGTKAPSYHDGMGRGDASMSMSGAGTKSGMAKSDQKSGMSMGMMRSGMTDTSNGSGQLSRMGMGKMGKGIRMMGMTKGIGGSQGMAMQSALPGFPGASNLYHIGATGFFLEPCRPHSTDRRAAGRTQRDQGKDRAGADHNRTGDRGRGTTTLAGDRLRPAWCLEAKIRQFREVARRPTNRLHQVRRRGGRGARP